MATITLLPTWGRDGIRDKGHRYQPEGFSLPLLFFLLIVVIAQAAHGSGTQALTAEASNILPVNLGEPAGCYAASGRTLNNGSYPANLVVTGDAFCPGSDPLPYYWQNNQWIPLPLPEGGYTSGYAESVSDNLGDGQAFTVQLYSGGSGWDTWVQGPGPVMEELALLEGTNHIDNAIISADGNYIVGGNSAGQQTILHAARWAKNGNGWSAPQDLGTGQAAAVTSNGSMVVGNTAGSTGARCNNGPWVWTDNGGGGSRVNLDVDSQVYDITHDGSIIVGCRLKPCDNPQNCATYSAPVYWTRQNDQWTRHDLEALDGVDSEAWAVADVAGQAIIMGYGFTNELGGILRVVVWIPEPDESYGPPLRLEALGGNFESWSWPNDINRQGIVLGWSETEPFGAAPPVIWTLFDQLPFQMNAGLSDAWYNPATDGQGFFIIVWEDIQYVFLAWFTYDVERPDAGAPATLGEAGHRWLTAEGNYANNRAELTVYLSQGGVFDSGNPAPVTTADGNIVLEFDNCLSGTVSYDIPLAGVLGVVPIQRITNGHVAHCETASAQAQTSLLTARMANR